MSRDMQSRRTLLKQLGLAGFGLSVADVPAAWALPRGWFAVDDEVVPFTDIPATFNPTPSATNRTLDLRKIDGPFTPKDQFFTTQHYGHPDINVETFRLKITGLVDRPKSFSIADLKAMRASEFVAGFECSGNSPRSIEGLASNAKWTGVPLKTLLDQAGVKAHAKEFVFFGADKGQEEVEFRAQKFTVEQQFGRSIRRDEAMVPDLFVAYALNGEPLTKHQGAPLRLIVPGWYGVANVKWLSQIHLQEEEYLGKFQARWYRTLKEETIDGETKWKETAISHMRLKSVVARVTRSGSGYKVFGFVLNDGTPIKSVDVRVDEGPWQPATLDPATKEKYGWKFFTYAWNGATAGEHTIVSRVTDVNGSVQPTAKDLENKKTFLEDNSQFPRKLTIS